MLETSPLLSHRVLDGSTGVNWFLADEVTAELSIVEALQKSSSYCSLGAFPFPSEPFHFLSLVRNEHSHQHGSAHPCSGAIMLLFFTPRLGGNATEDASCPLAHSPKDPRHPLVIGLCGEAILHCTDPLWCQHEPRNWCRCSCPHDLSLGN